VLRNRSENIIRPCDGLSLSLSLSFFLSILIVRESCRLFVRGVQSAGVKLCAISYRRYEQRESTHVSLIFLASPARGTYSPTHTYVWYILSFECTSCALAAASSSMNGRYRLSSSTSSSSLSPDDDVFHRFSMWLSRDPTDPFPRIILGVSPRCYLHDDRFLLVRMFVLEFVLNDWFGLPNVVNRVNGNRLIIVVRSFVSGADLQKRNFGLTIVLGSIVLAGARYVERTSRMNAGCDLRAMFSTDVDRFALYTERSKWHKKRLNAYIRNGGNLYFYERCHFFIFIGAVACLQA